MKVQELKEQKRALGYTNEMVSKLSGVPLGTVQKVFSGATAAPRFETLRAIERVLFPDQTTESIKEYAGMRPYSEIMKKYDPQETLILRDSAGSAFARQDDGEKRQELYGTVDYRDRKKAQGSYTVEDYRALPEGVRAELIDGVLYDMETPTYVHQFILGEIHAEMIAFQRREKHPCIPFIAPLSVQLDCDDRTMVEPDLMVLCDRKKLQNGIIYGAPDLVLEILSPSSRSRDLLIKFNKYWHAGVREYWIVDPEGRTVTVYSFDPMGPSKVYSFEDQIPVGISEGTLTIDMKGISERMKQLLPKETEG